MLTLFFLAVAASDHLAHRICDCHWLPPALHRHVSYNLKVAEGFSAGCHARHYSCRRWYLNAAPIFSGDLTTTTTTAAPSCSCKCRPLSRGVLWFSLHQPLLRFLASLCHLLFYFLCCVFFFPLLNMAYNKAG